MINFRNDDILQVRVFSKKQGKRLKPDTAFQSFLKCDEVFEKYNYPQILAVLSEGINYYPDWVDYIKKNHYRYQIELHGFRHYYYNHDIHTAESAYKDLKRAKDELENTFQCKITTWFIPYGKKHYPLWREEVCQRLGLICDSPSVKNPFMFHYWHRDQVEEVKKMIEEDVKRASSA
mgnify:FL=1